MYTSCLVQVVPIVTVAPTDPLANDKKSLPRLLPLKVSNNIASLQFYAIDYFGSNNENDVDLDRRPTV